LSTGDQRLDLLLSQLTPSITTTAEPLKDGETPEIIYYQIFFCKMYNIILTNEEVKSMVEAIQQLNNTLYELQTGKADAIYPTLGIGAKPAPGSSRNDSESVSDIFSQILTGKAFKDIAETNNNVMDIISKVITGKNVDDLELGNEDGVKSGKYDTTLDGSLQKSTDTEERIVRAVQALVLSFVHSDLKGDIKMAELRKEPFPGNIPQEFWDDLKAAYGKFAGDFTKNINDLDPYDGDNYGPLNITDDQ